MNMPSNQVPPFLHDRASFETFVAEHYDRIFRYAWRILGDRDDAEDLTQDICLALPRKMAGFRGECSVTTWLYRIVSNAAVDVMRKTKRRTDACRAGQEALEEIASAGRDRTSAGTWLLEAMQALPEDLRLTAALLVEEDMTQAQAAEILDVAPGTVAWRMSQVKSRLKSIAGENGHEG